MRISYDGARELARAAPSLIEFAVTIVVIIMVVSV